MERVKFLGYGSYKEMIADFQSGLCTGIHYKSNNGEEFYFNVEEDARGVNVVDENGLDYYKEDTFECFEDMIEKMVMPDGVSLKDVVNGENWK